jgi:hypothetical protein
MAMAMGQGEWGNSNGEPAIDQSIAMALGQLQWQWRLIDQRNVYVLFRGSMSCIVVVENVQNSLMAIIREVVPAIKTGPF